MSRAFVCGWLGTTRFTSCHKEASCLNASLRQSTSHSPGDDWSFTHKPDCSLAAFLSTFLVELLPFACPRVASGLACKETGGPTWDRTRDQSVMSRLL